MTSGNRRILIIDDNEAIHSDFQKTLMAVDQAVDEAGLSDDEAILFGEQAAPSSQTRLAFEIVSAMQGKDGHRAVLDAVEADKPFAVAFVDMRMPPGWDGVQTIERLWQADPHLQVVICTAYSDHTWEEIVGRLGGSDRLLILKKPFDGIEVCQLALSLTQKWEMTRQARQKLEDLESVVGERTQQLSHAARHDRLTGLVNREYFTQLLSDAIDDRSNRSDVLGLMFIDFDRFKIINDSLGHDVGDQLLVGIADRLSSVLRDFAGERGIPDGLWSVGRIGGDEFVVMIDRVASTGVACELAQGICQAMQKEFGIAGHEIFTTLSIGVTTSEIEADSSDQMLRDADAAMYAAKAAGRDRYVVFDRSMHEHTRERLELENAMRHGLERDEFSVFFQPIVCAETARITSVEALARWRHPRRGWVSPEVFISIAEEAGMISELGELILRSACDQVSAWRRDLPGCESLTVSVNLSKRQMLDASLLSTILAAVGDAGLSPEAVTLEITETVIMQHPDVINPFLTELRAKGFRLAMDDFGVGHSSLTCLHAFSLDYLKIDRAFINNLERDRSASAVVQAIVALASNLGIQVTAEGIETPSQLAQVQALECAFAQGYFFSKPVDVKAFEELMRKTEGWFSPPSQAA